MVFSDYLICVFLLFILTLPNGGGRKHAVSKEGDRKSTTVAAKQKPISKETSKKMLLVEPQLQPQAQPQAQPQSQSLRISSPPTKKNGEKPVRLAICLTGQLVRLELGSKLEYLLKTNLDQGISVDLYIMLDNELERVKGVKNEERNILGEHTIYKDVRFRGDALSRVVENYMANYTSTEHGINTAKFQVHTRLSPPSKERFLDPQPNNSSYTRQMQRRFQVHMHWMNGLRECMLWLDSNELNLNIRYDFVMRLRDDTYVMKPFKIDVARFKNHVVSTQFGGWGAVNDHNIFADRKYADVLFRGIVEEFYFSDKSIFGDMHPLGGKGPELIIQKHLKKYRIPTLLIDPCKNYPFIPIRGAPVWINSELYWKLSDKYVPRCFGEKMEKKFYVPIHSFDREQLFIRFLGKTLPTYYWSKASSKFASLKNGTYESVIKSSTPSEYSCKTLCAPTQVNYEWTCEGCDLPRVEVSAAAYCKLMEGNRSGNILFVGDILMKRFYQSFVNKMYAQSKKQCMTCQGKNCAPGGIITEIPCVNKLSSPNAIYVRNDMLTTNEKRIILRKTSEYPWLYLLKQNNISLVVMGQNTRSYNLDKFYGDLSVKLKNLKRLYPDIDFIWRNNPYGSLSVDGDLIYGHKNQSTERTIKLNNERVKSLLSQTFLDIPLLDVASPTNMYARLNNGTVNYCLPGPTDLWVTLLFQLLSVATYTNETHFTFENVTNELNDENDFYTLYNESFQFKNESYTAETNPVDIADGISHGEDVANVTAYTDPADITDTLPHKEEDEEEAVNLNHYSPASTLAPSQSQRWYSFLFF